MSPENTRHELGPQAGQALAPLTSGCPQKVTNIRALAPSVSQDPHPATWRASAGAAQIWVNQWARLMQTLGVWEPAWWPAPRVPAEPHWEPSGQGQAAEEDPRGAVCLTGHSQHFQKADWAGEVGTELYLQGFACGRTCRGDGAQPGHHTSVTGCGELATISSLCPHALGCHSREITQKGADEAEG